MSDDSWKREVDTKLISHDKDIHSIAQSVNKIASSVEKMATTHSDQAVRDERMFGQIEAVGKTAERAHKRIDENDKDKKRFLWIVLTPILLAVIGLVVDKTITHKKQDPQQIQLLTQAVQDLAKIKAEELKNGND